MKVIVHTDQADQWQQALSERLPQATIWKSQGKLEYLQTLP